MKVDTNTWAAIIAAGAAVVVGFASIGWQWRAHRQDELDRRRDRSVAFLMKRLDVLGQIAALLETSRRLRQGLRRPDGQDFRLVELVPEFRNRDDNDKQKGLVGQILAATEEIATLIEKNASVIPHPMPDTFLVFLHHQRGLEVLWKTGTTADRDDIPAFPRGINDDVDAAITDSYAKLSRLKADLAEL